MQLVTSYGKLRPMCFFFFFFNDTATTEIYTLSLHDALPICSTSVEPRSSFAFAVVASGSSTATYGCQCGRRRSEEHTSELQSQSNLVCRLLLEKKKTTNTDHKLNVTASLLEDEHTIRTSLQG